MMARMLYLKCSVKFIYSTLNQINNSIENQINIAVYTVYMTTQQFS